MERYIDNLEIPSPEVGADTLDIAIANLRDTYQTLWDPTVPRAIRNYLMAAKLDSETRQVQAAQATQQTLEQLDQISQDEVTKSLSRRSFMMLVDGLEKKGTLDKLQDDGWTMQITYLDLDKLGQHNDLGGEEGGDMALKAVVDVLGGKLFRRNAGCTGKDLPPEDPLPTLSKHETQIAHAAQTDQMHDILVRMGGDEFIVISLIPRDQNNQRESDILSEDSLHNETTRIARAMSGLTARYAKIREDVSSKKIGQDGLTIDFAPVDEVSVTATVTCTLAITRTNDLSAENIKSTYKQLNQLVEQEKGKRDSLNTKVILASPSRQSATTNHLLCGTVSRSNHLAISD